MISAVYAVEYLGFFTAAGALVLLEARTVVRYAAVFALTVGLVLSFQPILFTSIWPVLMRTPEYDQEVNFVECARVGGPALAPTPLWVELRPWFHQHDLVRRAAGSGRRSKVGRVHPVDIRGRSA
jgi:hypothetical protein